MDVGRAMDPDNEKLFTWWAPWRNMRARNIGWRLDYMLASPGVAERARELRGAGRRRHQRPRAGDDDDRLTLDADSMKLVTAAIAMLFCLSWQTTVSCASESRAQSPTDSFAAKRKMMVGPADPCDGASRIRRCSRQWTRCRATYFRSPGREISGLHRRATADQRRTDDFPALHHGVHDRGGGPVAR